MLRKKEKKHSSFQAVFSIHAVKCRISKTEVFEQQTFKLSQENAAQKILLRVAAFSDYIDDTSSQLRRLEENDERHPEPFGHSMAASSFIYRKTSLPFLQRREVQLI